MNIFNNSVVIGLCMTVIDIISMGITKKIHLGLLEYNWLAIASGLYAGQMLLFNYGLSTTSMAVLNLSWNLFSNIVITLLGIYYFKENINNLETYAIIFALFALFLFGLSAYYK